ncbi:MAG: hypothetical protein GF411_05375 [Candidatus Lokiarchaeota archaeon]|nr:hypothetical protein [Candidatus Lokiarchaeota archaeon]
MSGSKIVCPRCGYDDIALVKKEMISGGGVNRHFRCPRCSHTWTKKT